MLTKFKATRIFIPRSEPHTAISTTGGTRSARDEVCMYWPFWPYFRGLARAACTTFRPIGATPEERRRQLLCGELLPGERVRLVATDETVYEFRITEIDLEQGLLIGGYEQVPLADVVAL